MSREKYIININNKQKEFIELIYYDGSKLQINLEDNSILAWYDYNDSYEEWFYIKLKQQSFLLYISNKISLLEVFNIGEVYSTKRYYNNYNQLKELINLNSFTQYKLPNNNSLLGFDFTQESQYIEYKFKKTPYLNYNSYKKLIYPTLTLPLIKSFIDKDIANKSINKLLQEQG